MWATRLRRMLEGPILLAGDSAPDLFERSDHAHAAPSSESETAPAAPSSSEAGPTRLRQSLPDLTHD